VFALTLGLGCSPSWESSLLAGAPARSWTAALLREPAWTGESNQAQAWFGHSLASAGDVNGDSFSDLIVGAAFFDNGEMDEGRALVFLGSATGLSRTPAWTAESNQAFGVMGTSVASAGDVNGDGYVDVIVGASGFDNGQLNEGRVSLYLGSALGLSAAPAWSAESNQEDAYLGDYTAASAGDVNRDGFDDVIIGAYLFDNGQTDEGRAFVYHGSATGLSPTPAWTAESNQANAYFGWAVASAGDVNGDGYDDVIVGSERFDNGETDEGRAFVYLGSAVGLSPTPAWTTESNQAGGYLGAAVASAGDVNRDGYDDVMIGIQRYDNGQTDEGRTDVYLGSASGLSSTPAWSVESNQAGATSWSVASAGDVNGDGYDDILVGSPFFDDPEMDEGRVHLYLGSDAGVSALPVWTGESNQARSEFGAFAVSAGDVNGDGYADVAVSAYLFENGQTDEGRVFVYLGRAVDAGTTDAGTTDAGTTDAGTTDAGTTDAGTTDAGTTDAGTTDAGTTDAGTTDTGTTDAGTTHAGATDGGTSDAGVASDTGAGNTQGGPSARSLRVGCSASDTFGPALCPLGFALFRKRRARPCGAKLGRVVPSDPRE
jgi:hypothetical protein